MVVDVTYGSSMGCTHCMSDCKPDGQHMSVQTFSDVMDFMVIHKVQAWNFSGGEMFENPNILEMLKIIEERWNKNIIIMIATNGRILSQDMEIYDAVSNFVKKCGKRNIMIQVTDDKRFYPTHLNEKELYRLKKLDAIVDTVPGDPNNKNRRLYPQGRALINFPNAEWFTNAPKCANCKLMVKQGINTINKLVATLTMAYKMCTPVIAPDGSIKLGESALCPAVASIYDSEKEIIEKISNFKCTQCKIPLEILKKNNELIYNILF